MSNSALPQVGVDLVALGAADYLQALKEANQRMLESQDAAKRLVAALSLLPATNEKAQQTIAILNNQINEQATALAKLAIAAAGNKKDQEEAVKAYLAANEALRQTLATSNELTGVGPKAAQGIGNVTREARGLRDALFGAGLGISLLDSALGSQLPASAKQATNSLRLTADTMLAFAFLAPESGPVGLAIGALIGLLTSLGISALTVDPQIKALSDSLDKLGKKDDAAQGLAKLAGISDQNAAAALEYLKANQGLAASFAAQVQAAQPAIPVLQGVGDAIRALGDARAALASEIQKDIPIYGLGAQALLAFPQAAQNSIIYLTTYKDALANGASTMQASIAATNAVVAAQNAQATATAALAKQTQIYADIQNEINNTTSRVAAQKAQETIDKLRLEGASVDELDLLYLKLLQDKQASEGITPSFNGARAYAVSPVTIGGAESARQAAESDYSFLNGTATKLAKDLLSVQKQYNTDSANLASDHTRRLDEIGANAYEQQVRMERDLVRRLTEIRAQYNQDVTDAGADYRTRLGDLEANAQETRTKIAVDYAEKRAKIEQDYQDKVAQIQESYQDSLFDIVAKDDAKGLVRARLARDKALADAEKAREKDLANTDKERAKQEKDLADSLAKQKRQLDQDYERRLRDLAQAFEKQTASAQQNYRDQLADLNDATAKQYAAENAGYRRSQAALDKANAEKKQSLIDALVEIKGINDKYGQAIIDSLKSILDPATIIQLTNDLQKAFDTKIEIKVTPNAAPSTPGSSSPDTGPVATPSKYGTPGQYTSRVSMPASGSASASVQNGKVTIFVDNSVNSALLNSQIRTEALGVTTEVIRRGRGY